MIFDLSFSISLRSKGLIQPLFPIVSLMGETRLGVDLTTGNKQYFDGEDEILVSIGPLTDKELDDFMPGSKNDEILRLLFDYLLPAHMEVAVDLIQNPVQRITRLKDKENISKSVLGFSTYL
jgi:predicted component of type VI protein secretion system